jgi:ComF family protein
MISPPPFSKTVAGWHYQAPVDQLISSFKYSRKINHARVMATLFTPIVQQAYGCSPYPDMIIPTPLHWLRRWQRGFNQSELLTNWLAKSLSLPVTRCLKRSRATPAQRSLNAQQRKHNLKNAFSLSPSAHASIAGKTIAVVDDVMTTGATASTISQTLLKGGAKEVHIWCLARTDHKH